MGISIEQNWPGTVTIMMIVSLQVTMTVGRVSKSINRDYY
jgi:hypothetical protein